MFLRFVNFRYALDFIETSLIENHAAFCGQDDDLPDLSRRNRPGQPLVCLPTASYKLIKVYKT